VPGSAIDVSISQPAVRRLVEQTGDWRWSVPKGGPVQYMLLIYVSPDAGPARGSAEQQAEMPKWSEYTNALQDAGAMLAGAPLQPPETATTVRARNGDRLVTDGPFAETKEFLAGYYLIDASDLDAALDWAARMPNIDYGTVEVRPVMEIPGM
jgi:hypothetical protein